MISAFRLFECGVISIDFDGLFQEHEIGVITKEWSLINPFAVSLSDLAARSL